MKRHLLDEFSNSIAEELFADFPKWRTFASAEDAGDGSYFLVVDVPSPKEADTPDGLVIDTNGGEVTVAFDYYHSHFDNWRPIDPADGYGSALELVRSILNESVAIVTWFDGEKCLGSGQVHNGELPEVTFAFTRIRVRSWRGLHNELSCTGRLADADGSV